MSQGSYKGTGGGGGVVNSIAGDDGSITGANLTIYTHVLTNNSGATAKFINSGTISTLNLSDNDNNNMLLGFLCGNVAALATSAGNTGYGVAALLSLTNSNGNTAIGVNCLTSLTGGGSTFSDGYNTVVGFQAADLLLTGQFNTIYGQNAGTGYASSESSNICISSPGIVGDNNTTRIGNQGSSAGQQNTCFIAGIVGNTVSNAEFVTIDSTTGQMGVTAGAGFGSPTYFSAYRSTPQSLPGNTMTQVIFDTAIANVGSAYSTGTGFFTAPVTGFYGFSGTIMTSPIGVGITTLDLGFLGSVYGTTSFQIDSAAFATSGQYQATFSWNIPMTAGDTIGVNIYATGGATSSINGGALGATFNSQTLFSGYRIA